MFSFSDIVKKTYKIDATEAEYSDTIGWIVLGVLITLIGLIALSDVRNLYNGVRLIYYNIVHGRPPLGSHTRETRPSGGENNGTKSFKKTHQKYT